MRAHGALAPPEGDAVSRQAPFRETVVLRQDAEHTASGCDLCRLSGGLVDRLANLLGCLAILVVED